jgi:hypothetical protein
MEAHYKSLLEINSPGKCRRKNKRNSQRAYTTLVSKDFQEPPIQKKLKILTNFLVLLKTSLEKAMMKVKSQGLTTATKPVGSQWPLKCPQPLKN